MEKAKHAFSISKNPDAIGNWLLLCFTVLLVILFIYYAKAILLLLLLAIWLGIEFGFWEALRKERQQLQFEKENRVRYDLLDQTYKAIVANISGQNLPYLKYIDTRIVSKSEDAEIHEVTASVSNQDTYSERTLRNLFDKNLQALVDRDQQILFPFGQLPIGVITAFFNEDTCTIRIALAFTEKGVKQMFEKPITYSEEESFGEGGLPHDFEF